LQLCFSFCGELLKEDALRAIILDGLFLDSAETRSTASRGLAAAAAAGCCEKTRRNIAMPSCLVLSPR